MPYMQDWGTAILLYNIMRLLVHFGGSQVGLRTTSTCHIYGQQRVSIKRLVPYIGGHRLPVTQIQICNLEVIGVNYQDHGKQYQYNHLQGNFENYHFRNDLFFNHLLLQFFPYNYFTSFYFRPLGNEILCLSLPCHGLASCGPHRCGNRGCGRRGFSFCHLFWSSFFLRVSHPFGVSS